MSQNVETLLLPFLADLPDFLDKWNSLIEELRGPAKVLLALKEDYHRLPAVKEDVKLSSEFPDAEPRLKEKLVGLMSREMDTIQNIRLKLSDMVLKLADDFSAIDKATKGLDLSLFCSKVGSYFTYELIGLASSFTKIYQAEFLKVTVAVRCIKFDNADSFSKLKVLSETQCSVRLEVEEILAVVKLVSGGQDSKKS